MTQREYEAIKKTLSPAGAVDVKRPAPENVDGILNGLPPFHAALNVEEMADEHNTLWAVFDAEGSIVADVGAGEEMAVYFADALNALADLTHREKASA